MHTGTANVITMGPDTANVIARRQDDPDDLNPIKGILTAISISLSLWAVIIWALSELF